MRTAPMIAPPAAVFREGEVALHGETELRCKCKKFNSGSKIFTWGGKTPSRAPMRFCGAFLRLLPAIHQPQE